VDFWIAPLASNHPPPASTAAVPLTLPISRVTSVSLAQYSLTPALPPLFLPQRDPFYPRIYVHRDVTPPSPPGSLLGVDHPLTLPLSYRAGLPLPPLLVIFIRHLRPNLKTPPGKPSPPLFLLSVLPPSLPPPPSLSLLFTGCHISPSQNP